MKTKLTLLTFLCTWAAMGYAETLPEFEQALIQKYHQSSVSGRVDADQYNSQIAEAVIAKLQQDPNTWRYDFNALVDKRMLDVRYSPDRKIKIYQFDVSSGGSMRFFKNIAQWKNETGTHTQLIEEDLLIRELYQTELANRSTYFVLGQAIGSSCNGAANITAYHLSKTKLVEAPVFQIKNKRIQHINVPFDCNAFPENSPYLADLSKVTEYLIRVDPKMQFIDIQLVNQKHVPQNKYLRYQKQSASYTYQGVIKAKI